MPQQSLQDALAAGIRHHNAGQLPQAEAIYRQVLQQYPNQPDALHLLGVIAHQVRRHDVAIQLMRSAIDAGLRSAATFNNLGEAYRAQRDFAQAEQCYRQAIQRDPESAGAHSNLGIVLHELGRLDEATAEFELALRHDPNLVEALNNYGNLLIEKRRFDDAERRLRRAIEIRPNYAEAHNNLATLLEKRDRFDDAIAEYDTALKLMPNFVEAIVNLGSILQKQGKLDEAIAHWEQAVKVRPDYGDSHWNLGLAALARGDYRKGFQLYETRFACNHSRKYFRQYRQTRWDASPLAGKTILLFPEQGFGDVIQFARFIPLVAARGGRVILECHRELVKVMKSLDGVADVIASGSDLPPFDTYLPLLSVPAILGVTLENLPSQVPYLRASDDRRAAWGARMSAAPGMKKVGIVWAGKQTPDPKRTCPLSTLGTLLVAKNVAWFSLQPGEPASKLPQLSESQRPTDIGSKLTDFADTAGVIANLDLLITIDTAAAHLAGAMGVPTWTMLPFAPDWRWMYDREDSPWYPTMRLFRQPQADDWESVVSRIRAELEKFDAT